MFVLKSTYEKVVHDNGALRRRLDHLQGIVDKQDEVIKRQTDVIVSGQAVAKAEKEFIGRVHETRRLGG